MNKFIFIKSFAMPLFFCMATSVAFGAVMPNYPDFVIESNKNIVETSDSSDVKSTNEETEELFQVTIDPKYKTLLSAEIQSPVLSINKRMGEEFKKGDILIQLNDTIYQSNLNKAEALLDRAKVEYSGKKQLFDDNMLSLFDLKEAEAKVAVANADLTKAKYELAATEIKAPYDGKVVNLRIEEWELPQPGKELIEVVYDKKLLAKMLVPSTLLPEIKIGKPFTINLNEVNKKITANVLRIASVIDPSSSTVKIEGEIDNEGGLLRPGMTGNIEFNNVVPVSNVKPMNNVPPKTSTK